MLSTIAKKYLHQSDIYSLKHYFLVILIGNGKITPFEIETKK